MKIFDKFLPLWFFAMPIMAQDTDLHEQEIARKKTQLSQAMADIELRHQQAAHACWQRFAVNDCLILVRREKRSQLEPLRQQLLQLDAAERQLRLQSREKRLQDKEGARD
jgi:colicin import membrane protein